ncbi:MAG TPA: hypothetical protein VHZ33_37030 [Trebonia sp.]|jgi:hypothetical protein|nr:hypothetical protein [Trebonia sp.]
MNLITALNRGLAGARRHPLRATAICVPLVTASVLTGTTMASAGPEATLAVPAAALNAAPAQHVMLFDNDLPRAGASVKPTPVKIAWNEDGCDHDYGAPDVCVPWDVPGSTPQAKCAWLKSNGRIEDLKVYGTNRQDLPENAQGYVCTTGA